MTGPAPDWLDQARRLVAGSRLADLLAGTAGSTGTPPGHAGPPADDAGPPADHSAECRWCPVCAGLAAVRSRRPDVVEELVEGLADVLSTAAAVLRTHLADGTPPTPTPADTSAEEPGVPPAQPTAPVQRIDVA